MTARVLTTSLAAAMLAAGCAVPPRGASEPPALDLPAATAQPAIDASWWKAYGDPGLDALVEEALRDNRDLARAMARIDESRAALRAARAERLPSLSANAGAARGRVSENGTLPLGGASATGNDFRATLDIAYELDLWARAARLSDAARGELLASAYARDALRNALVAQVVQSYAALQSLDAQRTLFGSAVAAQRDSLGLQQLRLQGGDIGELDVRQLEAELLANEQQLPRIERARGEAERALALLVGRSPRAMLEHNVARREAAVAAPVADVPAGLPSDLLLRRPDVQAAEARLRAAGARVDAARAAYFPRIALTAAVGRQSSELSRLTDGPSLIWNLALNLTAPIWDGGRLAAQSEAARARAQQAELDYRDSVAAAFKEVHDALGARAEALASLDTGERRVRALQRAAELTRLRYDAGQSSRLDLIEAERFTLAARAQLADSRRALAAAQADLYKALGGGWRLPESPAGLRLSWTGP